MVLEGGLWYVESVSKNNVARFKIVKKKIHTHTQNIKNKIRDLRFPWRSVLRLVFWDVMPFCLVDRHTSLRERGHWGDQDVDGRIILRWIFRKLEGVMGTGWSWLRIGTGGRHLWVW